MLRWKFFPVSINHLPSLKVRWCISLSWVNLLFSHLCHSYINKGPYTHGECSFFVELHSLCIWKEWSIWPFHRVEKCAAWLIQQRLEHIWNSAATVLKDPVSLPGLCISETLVRKWIGQSSVIWGYCTEKLHGIICPRASNQATITDIQDWKEGEIWEKTYIDEFILT